MNTIEAMIRHIPTPDATREPEVSRRGWGCEIIYASNEDYCGKILEFDRPNALMSMHYHLAKDETWYCLSGRFIIYWIETTTAQRNQESFVPGCIWRNRPGEPHQIECIGPGQILEVSTRDSASDNYRVEKGDSQRTERYIPGPNGSGTIVPDEPAPVVDPAALDDPRMSPETERAVPPTSYICGDCGQPHENPNECPACGSQRVIERAVSP